MVRPGFAALVVFVALGATAGTGRAADLPRWAGLYQGNQALPMLDSKVEVTVRGPIVEAVVTQRFQSPSDHAIEATYIFPLPADAAVTAMSIHTGGRVIKAAIERRDDAQRRYEAAVSAGVHAALLDQERPDVFTQTVSAIPARGTVEITLRYDTVAAYHDGTWELAVPLVVAPRYVPGTASGLPTTGSGRAPDTNRAPDASRVTPHAAPGAGGATTIALAFTGGVDGVSSPTHELATAGGGYTLVDPKSDHDAIVRWRAALPAGGWVEQDDDGGYAAVVVEAARPAAKRAPVRCLVVLDRAATTRGDAAAIERPFVRALMAAFDPASKIAVTGSDAVAWGTPDQAMRAIDTSWATVPGAFDLTKALKGARPEGGAIVLISDGLVADDAAAIAAARALATQIHVIGIGPAPARGLLTQIATASGGTIRFATPGDDVAVLAKNVALDLASPPAPLAVSWGTLNASDVVPAILPRLGNGQALVVLARVQRAQRANARARGELFAIEPLRPQRALDGAVTVRGALARRWARNRLDELVLARSAPAAVAAHAMRFGLVSPYTSMVAVGTEVVVQGGVKRSVAVPVSVPAGMRWQPVKRELAVDGTTATGAAAGAPPVDTSSTVQGTVVEKEHTKNITTPKSPPPPPAAPAPVPPADAQKGKDSKRKPPPRHHGDDDTDEDDKPAKRGKKKGFEDDRHDRRDKAPKKDADEESPEPAEASRDRFESGTKSVAAKEPMPDVTSSGEVLQVEGRGEGRGLRLTGSLGGGFAIRGTADGLVAIDGRAELGRRTLVGFDAGLWLVGGLNPEGRFLITVARRGIARYVELGAGAGLHLGDGAGPALSLRLRTRLPWFEHVAPFLRYDGALLYKDGARHGENAGTLGLEWSFE